MNAAQAERIIKLSEEAAELVQACMKALLHGLEGKYDDGETNIEAIEREVGDVRAIIAMMIEGGELDPDVVSTHEVRKRVKVLKFTYFQPGSKPVHTRTQAIPKEPPQ